MTTIGVIGAGHIGSQVARAAANVGFDVVVSNASGPESLAGLVSDLGPHGRASTVADTARDADVVVVAVPLAGFADIPPEPLAGKIVLNTTNYNPRRDGHIAELDNGTATVAGLLQARLPNSRVVKAFSAISAAEVTTDGKPEGTPGRRALPVAGEDAGAKQFVADFYNRAGFDTVDIGGLDESWRIGMGQPAFVTHQNAEELRANVARANRK
jgi:8-hydroxy-5-deazaflavin:NADPH oxidoreductase